MLIAEVLIRVIEITTAKGKERLQREKGVLFAHQVKFLFLSGNVPWTFRKINVNKKTSTYFVIWWENKSFTDFEILSWYPTQF